MPNTNSARREENNMITQIKTIANASLNTPDLNHFFNHLGQWLITCLEVNEKISPEYFETMTFEALKEENEALYAELKTEAYKNLMPTLHMHVKFLVKILVNCCQPFIPIIDRLSQLLFKMIKRNLSAMENFT